MNFFDFKAFLLALLLLSLSVTPATAGLFDKCDFFPETPRPNWMGSGFDMPGFHIGLGLAGEQETEEQQRESSVQDALNNLSRNISVKVISVLKKELKSSEGYEEKLKKEIELITETSTKELLRDVNVRKQWLNRDGCKLWTLAFVSKEAVQKVKTELVMKNKLKTMTDLYEQGAGPHRVPDINARLRHISDARMLLDEIDFSYLPHARPYDYYKEKFEKAIEGIKQEIEQTQGRMVISVWLKSGALPEHLVGKLVSHLKAGRENTDRLSGQCSGAKECLQAAKEQGFERLTLVAISQSVVERSLGALRGTLTVEMTLYEVRSGRIVEGPVSVFARVVGWTEEDLNWKIAVDKIIKSDKLTTQVDRL